MHEALADHEDWFWFGFRSSLLLVFFSFTLVSLFVLLVLVLVGVVVVEWNRCWWKERERGVECPYFRTNRLSKRYLESVNTSECWSSSKLQSIAQLTLDSSCPSVIPHSAQGLCGTSRQQSVRAGPASSGRSSERI